MPIGAGKYDDLCTHVRTQAQAQGVVVIVFDGKLGSGFSVQADLETTLAIPKVLRGVANQLEQNSAGLLGESS